MPTKMLFLEMLKLRQTVNEKRDRGFVLAEIIQ